MADEKEDSKVNTPLSDPPHQSVPFVEVLCKSTGKNRRFAIGTEAGFALNFMNKKLLLLLQSEGEAYPLASSHIEAVKEGEEPIVFGPTAPLVNFGPGWKLQTVTDPGVAKGVGLNGGSRRMRKPYAKGSENLHSTNDPSKPALSSLYIGKILLALVLIFVFGAIFTLILENLPQLILYTSQ